MLDVIYNDLFDFNCNIYDKDGFDADGNLVCHPPPLDEVWLDESERRHRHERLCHQRDITEEREQSKWLHVPVPTFPPEPLGADEGAFHLS